MTVMALPFTGAPSASTADFKSFQWLKIKAEVRRLQMRIAKAYREGKHGKVKALQWLLTHSLSAKLLAVKRVVQNQGSKTPGIDNVLWRTSTQKIKAAMALKRHGYKPKPLKRIYIPKKQKGKLRPLSIPTMECRAQQALYLLALEPVAELKSNKNAYGFRPYRSTADAIEQCFKVLNKSYASTYILECDIQNCFDSISHTWLLKYIPMDKEMLKKWLAAGYLDEGVIQPTTLGTPQGSIISPTLLNLTLAGMESAISAVTNRHDKVNVIIYADDFIITGASQAILEQKVRPVVESFLRERGLSLSGEKTKITHIEDGFDFLGMNIRKYKSKLIIKPAKSNIDRFLADIREVIKENGSSRAEKLIWQLNLKIRGWGNYYQHVCAKETFARIDHFTFTYLWRWAERRHPTKRKQWIKDRYFRRRQLRDWILFAKVIDMHKDKRYLDLVLMSEIPIKRHIKIRADATPYDPAYKEYLDKRISKLDAVKSSRKIKSWQYCLELSDQNRTNKTGSPNDLIKA